MSDYQCAICKEDIDSDRCRCVNQIRRVKGDLMGDKSEHWMNGRLSSSALDVQVGGSHYKDMAIQPVEFIHKNGMGFLEGNIIKYICRFRAKNGIEDLKKARHYLDILIEAESVDR